MPKAAGIRAKICGLSTPATLAAAVDAGAAYVGFVFFPPSPRYLEPEPARALALAVPPGIMKVALTVDADDAALDALTDTVPLDMLQLHGSETPERVGEIRARYGLPVMKVVGIGSAEDLAGVPAYEAVADQIMLDTKAPPGAVTPGGNAVAFDWNLVAGRRWTKPWMLAGGLTAGNVAEAVRLTGARQVDVSSGVESARGVKDAGLIGEFMAAVARI